MVCCFLSFSLSFSFYLSLNISGRADNEADVFIERCHRILGYQSANTRDVQNLRNWVDGNGCIAREETAYLQSSEGLLTLRHSHDSAVIWLETIVENSIIRLHSCFGRVRSL